MGRFHFKKEGSPARNPILSPENWFSDNVEYHRLPRYGDDGDENWHHPP